MAFLNLQKIKKVFNPEKEVKQAAIRITVKAPSISELHKELSTHPPKRIAELAIRLAKHKKENKELLTYLLFEAGDEEAYINKVKEEIDFQFSAMNNSNLYLSKKTLRKILRGINKCSKFSAQPSTEVELRIYYCRKIISSGIPFKKSAVLVNLYTNQLNKINSAIAKMHEDLQFDFNKEVEEIAL
jgi:hypothetical protein